MKFSNTIGRVTGIRMKEASNLGIELRLSPILASRILRMSVGRRSLRREPYWVMNGLVQASHVQNKIFDVASRLNRNKSFWAGLQKTMILEASSRWLGTVGGKLSSNFPSMKGEMSAPWYLIQVQRINDDGSEH